MSSTRTDLLTHQGRVVPWVTRWTNEVSREGVSWSWNRDGTLLVGYADGHEQRENSGILWQREGIMRGGEPQYSQVSTYRQRLSMRKAVCQVCGQKIDERPILWLIPTSLLDHTRDQEAVTVSAPTCAACVPTALKLCPHLKRVDHLIAHVLEYELWGVCGGAAIPDREAKTIRQVKNVMYPYRGGRPGIAPTAMIAKQQAVTFTKYTIEHLGN